MLFRLLPAFDLHVLPNVSYTNGEPRFVGLGNFVNLWNDPIFWQAAWNTFRFTGAATVLNALSLNGHFDDFARGAINLEDVVYYLSLIVGGLFVATRVLETRRYR